MKCGFLHRSGSGKLLLLFNGWGLDDRWFAGWTAPGIDVFTVCDYREPVRLPDFPGYSEIRLAAWSLGVYAAAEALTRNAPALSGALAVNGTLRPMDAEFGIAPGIFRGTIANWSADAARARFYRRLSGGSRRAIPPGDWRNQQMELQSLAERIEKNPVAPDIFRKVVTGAADRIFPAAVQWNFWSAENVEYRELPGAPHDITALFGSFREMFDAACG